MKKSRYIESVLLVLLVCFCGIGVARADAIPVFAVVRSNELQKIDPILKSSCVAGVTLYWSWRMLEPKKDEYALSDLDSILARLARSNVPVNLAVLPGRWSPAWLKAEGVPYMSWEHRDSYVEDGVARDSLAPVPWNETYLSRFELMMGHVFGVASRYKNVKSIAVTGPSNTNGLEAALIGADSELRRVGFDQDEFVSAWIRMAKKFASFGGGMKLTVALHERFGDKRIPEVGRRLDRELKAVLGDRYIPMLLGFEGKPWFVDRNGYAGLILEKGTARGAVQAIRKYSGSEGKSGLDAALKRAGEIKPAWFEVWADDVLDGLLSCK